MRDGLELQAEAVPCLFELLELQATEGGRGCNLLGGTVGVVGPVLLAVIASR
jgi:hypothetical protein